MQPFRFKRKPKGFVPPRAEKPKYVGDDKEEQLLGEVQGMPASQGEERMARALSKAGIQYQFRYSVGAPRNMPGWKELDFLIQHRGLVYAVEVDTAFTHREKQNTDVLHDAIILNDKYINSLGSLYPKVFHADGESDLVNQQNADNYVKRVIG